MQRTAMSAGSRTLLVIGLLAIGSGWLVTRMGMFGGSAVNVRDFLVGFSVPCLVISLLLAAGVFRK
ncbi:MAG TPA: hypothetical protein VFE05_22600 [Longimicrobiaceae bacterium]|jgi:hypothetical protein|nr:hypothetical protein [Longimicrobiaceae bacterium]